MGTDHLVDVSILSSRPQFVAGDLVMPFAAVVEEYFYLFPVPVLPGQNPVEVPWPQETGPGMILEVVDIPDVQNYQRVTLLVGKVIGWTYTDWIRLA